MQLQAVPHSWLTRLSRAGGNVQPAVATSAKLMEDRRTPESSPLTSGKMLPPKWVWPTTE